MQGRGGLLWQEILKKIGGFNANSPKIGQSSAPSFAVNLAQAAKQSFHADEIPFRMLGGVLREKRAVARSQFHLQPLAAGNILLTSNGSRTDSRGMIRLGGAGADTESVFNQAQFEIANGGGGLVGCNPQRFGEVNGAGPQRHFATDN